MMAWLIFGIYRFILLPLTLLVLQIFRPFLNDKMKTMIEDRSVRTWPEVTASPIWIHASSGEIEYAKPLIRQIKSEWPQRPILLTYFSPSAKKLISKIEGLDVVVPLPWDHRGLMKKFIQHFHPEILLISRTDVWPECVYQSKKLNIPSILFSATLAEKSSRKGIFSQFLTQFAFNQLSEIHCVSKEDELQIRSLNVSTPIEVTGDTRYDQVIWRLQHPNIIREELKPTTHPVFVAGSTWPQDEKEILPSLKKFISNSGKVILAPHEISESRLTNLEKEISEQGFSCIRYSKSKVWSSENILILDQIGILAEIYTWGDIGFVGGSFKDRVHSVMEPLAAGLPVIVGPFHTNNREALYFQNLILAKTNQNLISGVMSAQNSGEIQYHLDHICEALKAQPEMKKTLQNKVQSLSGATIILVRKLSRLKKD